MRGMHVPRGEMIGSAELTGAVYHRRPIGRPRPTLSGVPLQQLILRFPWKPRFSIQKGTPNGRRRPLTGHVLETLHGIGAFSATLASEPAPACGGQWRVAARLDSVRRWRRRR